MPRYSATIEFYSIYYDIDVSKASLEGALYNMNPEIKSIVKLSISPEEAIKRIQELINGTAAYGSVSADNIQTILNNVI
jgi:hypothetical protein